MSFEIRSRALLARLHESTFICVAKSKVQLVQYRARCVQNMCHFLASLVIINRNPKIINNISYDIGTITLN